MEKTNAKKVPVYGSEIEQVKKGCVASIGIDYFELGRQTGQMAAKVLKGEATCEEMPYESLFDGFTFAGKVIALYIVEGFFVALWSMLFVIPGIIAVYRYSFAIWNLCQNPELGVMEALNRSKRQTIGYKGQLFGLHLSFIGWYLIVFVIVGVYEGVILALMPDSFLGIMLGSLILTVLTGVVDIYLTPYFALSECGFYLRATAPEEPPRQDRSSYTPEF